MPEEKTQAPSPAPEQAAVPAPESAPVTDPSSNEAPAPAPAGIQPAPKKGTNGCLIAIIVVAILAILIGAGIFITFRFIKNKVSDTIKTDGSSASINLGDTKGSVSTSGDSYSDVTEQNPTVALVKDVDTAIKPTMVSVFGGAKTNAWSSLDANTGSLTYLTKNKITSADSDKVKNGIVAAGYTSDSNYASSDGSILSFTKGDVNLSVTLSTLDEANTIVVTISKSAATTSEETAE